MTYTFTSTATINATILEKLAILCANDCIEAQGAELPNSNIIEGMYVMMLQDEAFIDEETGDSLICDDVSDVEIIINGNKVFPVQEQVYILDALRNALAKITLVKKVQDKDYVSREKLAALIEMATGKVYGLNNKKNTRKNMVAELEQLISEMEEKERRNEEVTATMEQPEPEVETETAQQTEENIDKWSVDYWWNQNTAGHILKRVIEQAAKNDFKNIISVHMVHSFIFEMMFGKQLIQWVNHKKVMNFSKENNPREWQLVSDFCDKFFSRYLHFVKDVDGNINTKVFGINSEAICWGYRRCSYVFTTHQNGREYKVFYDLDYSTKTMVRRDNGNIFDLSPATFKKLDETCNFWSRL